MSQVVFITGCSTGIGRALSLAFNAAGYTVYASARQIESLQDLATKGIHTLPLDVNNHDNITSAIQRLGDEQGKIDVLINNAGFAAMGPLAEIPADKLREQFETNVISPVVVTQACLPLLRNAAKSRGSAKVVNIGSVSGILTTPFSGAYCASKAAVHALSDAMRMELAPFGIKVITIQPGAIRSSFGDNSAASIDWLDADSIYAPVRAGIEARTRASQEHPTPAEEFSEKLIAAVMIDNPGSIIRIGNGSFLLPRLKLWLSTKRLDNILSKRFRLNILTP